jgi:hypothetical protein
VALRTPEGVENLGHVYLGAFNTTRAYLRTVPRLESTNNDQDDFIKDLSKVRVIERFALAVPNNLAFCDLTLVSASRTPTGSPGVIPLTVFEPFPRWWENSAVV